MYGKGRFLDASVDVCYWPPIAGTARNIGENSCGKLILTSFFYGTEIPSGYRPANLELPWSAGRRNIGESKGRGV